MDLYSNLSSTFFFMVNISKQILPWWLMSRPKEGRSENKDKCNFYKFSRGSAYETKNHLIYGTRVGYFEIQKSEAIISEIEAVIHELNKIIKTLDK